MRPMPPLPLSEPLVDGRKPRGRRRNSGSKRSMWGWTGVLVFPVDEVIIHQGPKFFISPLELIIVQVGAALLMVVVPLWKRGRSKWNTRR